MLIWECLEPYVVRSGDSESEKDERTKMRDTGDSQDLPKRQRYL